MSQIGIHAGGYLRVSDYARSVDRVLLDLQSEDMPDAETVSPVLSLLDSMSEEQSAAPLVQLIKLQWGEVSTEAVGRLTNIIAELKAGKPSNQTVSDLESLATVLDKERVTMRLRLRGV
jgi:hypothetical protein